MIVELHDSDPFISCDTYAKVPWCGREGIHSSRDLNFRTAEVNDHYILVGQGSTIL